MIEFQLLLATFSAWANRRQGSVVTYLVEENRVLKEQLESSGRRLRFTDDERRRGPQYGFEGIEGARNQAPPDRPVSWATFVRAHASVIAAADFFATEVWTTHGLVRHFTLFFMDVGTRRVHVAGTTTNPTSEAGPRQSERAASRRASDSEGLLKYYHRRAA